MKVLCYYHDPRPGTIDKYGRGVKKTSIVEVKVESIERGKTRVRLNLKCGHEITFEAGGKLFTA